MIVLAPALVAALQRQAEAAYPEECCGLFLGRDSGEGVVTVTGAEPSANLAADRRRRFEVDPALYLRLRHAPPEAAGRLIGLYHSHPEGMAVPSSEDARAAWQEGWVWLIVPVEAGRAGIPAAFRLVALGGPFEPVALEVR